MLVRGMSDYTVTVHGAATSEKGVLYAAVAYYDGEAFSSVVMSESDVADDANVTSNLLQKSVAFYDLWLSPRGSIYVCDDTGHVHMSTTGKTWKKQKIASKPLTVVWGFDDGNVYAAGSEGIVYRSDGKTWSKLSKPLGHPIANVRGSSPNDLYVCAEGGLLVHYDGKSWHEVGLSTDARLMALLVLSPKEVLVGGSGGAMFRGAGTKWKSLPTERVDVYALASFAGDTYVGAGSKGVFRLGAKGLTKVKDTFAVYRLSSSAKHLTLAGEADAVRFDGADWSGPTYS